MRRTCMIALAMYSCLAGQTVPAQVSGYSDDEVKAQFVEAGMFCHAELIRSGYRRAFEMAGCDTNRYARILRELAVENTNETEWDTVRVVCRGMDSPSPSISGSIENIPLAIRIR